MPLPRQVIDLQVAWRTVDRGFPVFVVRKDQEYLCEGPYERFDLAQDEADDDTEACVRLFLLYSDAVAYAEGWRAWLGLEPGDPGLAVMTAHMNDVWSNLGAIVANSYADYQQPARIDLCKLNEAGTPIVIDTLFSEMEELH